jgi:hypothetical protein
MSFLGKQPKEVTATIYSAYIAILFGFAAVFAKKKGKRSFVMIASATCVVFTAVFCFTSIWQSKDEQKTDYSAKKRVSHRHDDRREFACSSSLV